MKLKKMHWLGLIAAAVIILLSAIFLRDNQKMFYFLSGIAVGIGALPFVIGMTF